MNEFLGTSPSVNEKFFPEGDLEGRAYLRHRIYLPKLFGH